MFHTHQNNSEKMTNESWMAVKWNNFALCENLVFMQIFHCFDTTFHWKGHRSNHAVCMLHLLCCKDCCSAYKRSAVLHWLNDRWAAWTALPQDILLRYLVFSLQHLWPLDIGGSTSTWGTTEKMSTIHLNSSGSHFNHSRHSNCWLLKDDTDVGLSLISVILISNFVVGLPANVWVVWLICHIPKEVLSSEIYLLSLAVCEILNCLWLPAQLYCMYSFEKLSHELSFLLSVLWMLGWVGRPIFQCFICVERYFAVVHPLVFIR